mmetsp:Transcript_10546/g.27902  ORF Transcript_10546/g.27902 Transcript_10546/m.27902 type:complete len:202 (-) Transcript_10546:341-946(-)
MAAAGTVTSNMIAQDVTPQMSARRSSASPRAASRSFRSAAVIERPESSAVSRSDAVAASRARVATMTASGPATSCATAAHTRPFCNPRSINNCGPSRPPSVAAAKTSPMQATPPISKAANLYNMCAARWAPSSTLPARASAAAFRGPKRGLSAAPIIASPAAPHIAAPPKTTVQPRRPTTCDSWIPINSIVITITIKSDSS